MRLGNLALLKSNHSQVQFGRAKLWLEPQGLSELADGLISPAGLLKYRTQIIVQVRALWVQSQCPGKFRNRGIQLAPHA